MRILRVCDICGGVDDGPRHVLAGGAPNIFPRPSQDVIGRVLAAAPESERARLLAELADTSSSDRHMDCCRNAGCPDGTCDTVPDLRDSELLAHLTKEG